MLTRSQKEEIVQKLTKEIEAAPAAVFADFKGLGANDMVSVKRELRDAGSSFQIVKKKLLAIALKNNNIDLDPKSLDGQIAVSVSQDEVTSAKLIAKIGKDNDNIKLVGGVLDGDLLTLEEAVALSKMPSLDELRGQFVGLLQSPAQSFASAIQAPQKSFAGAMEALATSKS